MVYRVNFFLEILGGILSSLIVVLLWMAIYRYSGKDLIGGYSLAEMVTYLLGAGLINNFFSDHSRKPGNQPEYSRRNPFCLPIFAQGPS